MSPRTSFRSRLARAIFASVSGAFAAAAPVHAFPILSGPDPVVEYYNVYLGHYFMTLFPAEMESIDNGRAGPGWVRTGFAFKACQIDLPGMFCVGTRQATVSRFYGTPGLGPNSHFYTADPAEAQILKQPGTGWSFEEEAFATGIPGADGKCAAGTPVYRLYNNRAAFNDSNHRYVTSDSERARMIAKGWIDEGARFCSDGALEIPIKSFELTRPSFDNLVRPSAQCEDETLNIGPCIAVNNLPTPAARIGPSGNPPPDFFDRTGFSSTTEYVVDASQPAAASASSVFVQASAGTIGVHVDTRVHGPNAASSVNPLYQLHTTVEPGQPDARFFPFAAHESDVQLAVTFTLNVKTITVRNEGGAAYGHPTLEFIDQRSGRHVYFTTLAYGTVPAIPVFIALDEFTGRPIVGTSFREDSPYIRTFGLPSLPVPATGFVSPNFWGWGGAFEYRMDRTEFRRVIDSWRTLAPELSSDPADYLLDNFHFNNEVFGDGEIGINLTGFKVQLLRR